ncbi:leukemia inhibitory factor receptor-like isoform X4 [Micropterus dolomieu]|uniref:leukemia inhibitory factor receptor-like isoform X4 n=1 Tax=Micropterus dolomieu TaxID=147949 RepID=UPI001E8CAD49|nr:leukemia inhibitory factor receptor-like isoform X4 [Micropterus dolomieu]
MKTCQQLYLTLNGITTTDCKRRIKMITWLLLVSLFCKSTQGQNAQENRVLHCGPKNLTLTTSEQTILSTWEDDRSCSAVQDVLIYELVVLIADKQVHYEEVAVTPDQIGATHSWNWTSHLPLECASHSVRLTSRYKNHTSPWKQEQSIPAFAGRENSTNKPEVFPRDRVFKVGSRATFCCILPVGQTFKKMYAVGYDANNNNDTIKISSQTYALTIHLNQPSGDSDTDVKCQTDTSENGASAYSGYPPGDKDLWCETRDLQSVECKWTVGRNTHLLRPTVYQLLGSECAENSCSQKVQVVEGERNWTLTAQNELGKVELQDRADLTKRVHMYAPQGVRAPTVNARNVSLEWKWAVQQYNNLNITCQLNVSHGGTHTISENFGVGLNFAVLKDLKPNWKYNVVVRCRTTAHFWKWGDWSTSVNFHTRGDVPDALDVWMQMMDNRILIIWKMPLANQSHGRIIDYEVTWARTTERDQQNRTTVAHNQHSLDLSQDCMSCIVTVTARNINGSSSPSTITIPSLSPDRTGVSWIIGSESRFNLSWSASPTASCGYIVDWCPTTETCSVEWLKVPANETNASIFSKNFSDGVRYTLSIYACTQGAPVLLERREGYVSEKRIENSLFKSLKSKQRDSDVELSWEPISLKEQTAFIQGYVLYGLDSNNKLVINVSEENPEATSLTARNLQISSYTFTVKALTAVGECGTTSITVTLKSLTDNLIKAVFISLVTIFCVLSLITILCYKHWTRIKQKVCPPIPKPVLTDKWLTSPGEHSCRPLGVDQCHHSEVDIMDVPELQCNTGVLVNDYVSQEFMPFVFTQTQKGYYNQPLKKHLPPPLTIPTAAIPSGLPTSPVRCVFPNPSYDLIMQIGDQLSNSGPELIIEYQPHNNTESFPINQTKGDPESPMSCVSTYILLPQSPSN